MASSSTFSRWVRPEVIPLFAAVGVAVGICGFQLVRTVCFNPDVRFVVANVKVMAIHSWLTSGLFFFNMQYGEPQVNKENRAAGVLENFAEGEKYAEHSLRKFVRNRSPEIMPAINGFFTNPK